MAEVAGESWGLGSLELWGARLTGVHGKLEGAGARGPSGMPICFHEPPAAQYAPAALKVPRWLPCKSSNIYFGSGSHSGAFAVHVCGQPWELGPKSWISTHVSGDITKFDFYHWD